MELNIVDLLVQAIQRKKVSQTKIAEELGVSRAYISSIFSSKKMNTDLYAKIIVAAGLSPAEIFCNHEKPNIEKEITDIRLRLDEIAQALPNVKNVKR